MKKIILPLLLFFITINVKSQDIIDICAKEIFDCTSEKMKAIDNPTDKQMDLFFSMCTREIYNSRHRSILNFMHLPQPDGDTFGKFSDLVTERMANPVKINEVALEKYKNKIIKNDFVTVKCVVTGIYTKKHLTIEANDQNGVILSFIYLKPFSTDIMIRYNRIKPGDRFLITYDELDIYDEDIKDFITYNFMTQLLKQ